MNHGQRKDHEPVALGSLETCDDSIVGLISIPTDVLPPIESDSNRECRACRAALQLIRTVHFPDRQEVIRAFKCDCGERIWDE